MKKKYAFFGGGFNPPTFAHIELAKKANIEYQLDRLFFVPIGNLYQKDELIDEHYRYEMLKIICDKEEKLEVSDIELRQSKPLKAIDAFHMIQKKYGENEIFYVMGMDNLRSITTWKNAEELLGNFRYIILNRNGQDAQKIIQENLILKNYKQHFHIIENIQYADYRSGMIRDAIKQKRTEEAKKYTDPDIIAYIKEHHLYQK